MAQLDKIPPKGRVYRFRHTLFWAQGGTVCFERMDQDGAFSVLKRADFVVRLVLFKKTLEEHLYDDYGDERNEIDNFVFNCIACNREARYQGDMFDPRVIYDKEQERRTQKGYIYLGDGSKVNFGSARHESGSIGGGLPYGTVTDGLARSFFKVGPNQRPIEQKVRSERDFPSRANDLPAFGPAPKPGPSMQEMVDAPKKG